MRGGKEKWADIRIRMIGALFVAIFAVTAARAIYLQVIKNQDWTKMAERQHQRVVALTPARGTIFDANGAALAVSVEMDSCFAEPRKIEHLGGAAARLAPLLGMSKETLAKKLAGNKNFVWLQRQLTPDLVGRIKGLEIEGIGFVKETRRFYPNSEVAAHVIGFTGLDPAGLEGIEFKYDSTLLGNTGFLVTERDALGRDVALKGMLVKKSSKGYNVTLTLDKNIQYIAEKELAKAVVACGGKGGSALVMEPQTGKVLALANYPDFNPNASYRYPSLILRNRAISDSFEPGSTFKVFLVAAALEEKVIRPNDSFNCENGSYSIGGKIIHDTHSYGRLAVPEILKYSSNIGAAKIGIRLGKERLYAYLKEFGIGEKTGVDLPGEASGYLRDRSQWFGVDLATISFGQGVTATPLQMATAFSAVANGGVLMKPYLVSRITDDSDMVIQQFEPLSQRRVISTETARTLSKMLQGVTDEGGTGVNAALASYKVAGKTGTSQKVDAITKSYSLDKRVASFVGFVPADNPRLTIMVVVDEPKTSPYGGVVAAPAFSAIAIQSLCYLKVAPSGADQLTPKVVEAKSPAPQPTVAAFAEGTIVEAAAGSVMPNFTGLSMRQVLRNMEKQGLNVRLTGSGRAVAQNPRAGERIRTTDQVWVRFASSN